MESVIILKVLLASAIWSVAWLTRFTYTGAIPNTKNMLIVLGPWILITIYFFLFWWG